MEQKHIDAHNWYLKNQQNLGIYRSEWIAFTSNSVIAHNREYLKTIPQIEPERTDFVLARVHEYDCWEPPKFRGVRFQTMRTNDRSGIFDLFDIEFKQTSRQIVFRIADKPIVT
jgi:hypothetical protein